MGQTPSFCLLCWKGRDKAEVKQGAAKRGSVISKSCLEMRQAGKSEREGSDSILGAHEQGSECRGAPLVMDGRLFALCSLSCKLTDSPRVSPALPARSFPSPQFTAHIFPDFSVCSSNGAGVLPSASHSLGSEGLPFPNRITGRSKTKPKTNIQEHVDTHKTLFPAEMWEFSPDSLGKCTVLTCHFGPLQKGLLPILPPATYMHSYRV